MTDRRGPQAQAEDRSDLTPEEARAEVEAFFGQGWRSVACESIARANTVLAAAYFGNGLQLTESGPTYRAAVDALKAAWRDAVRPWVAAGAQAGYDIGSERGINLVTKEACVARVLKEDQ